MHSHNHQFHKSSMERNEIQLQLIIKMMYRNRKGVYLATTVNTVYGTLYGTDSTVQYIQNITWRNYSQNDYEM